MNDTDLAGSLKGPHIRVQVGPFVDLVPASEVSSGDQVRESGLPLFLDDDSDEEVPS